jgi:hypothetical protein
VTKPLSGAWGDFAKPGPKGRLRFRPSLEGFHIRHSGQLPSPPYNARQGTHYCSPFAVRRDSSRMRSRAPVRARDLRHVDTLLSRGALSTAKAAARDAELLRTFWQSCSCSGGSLLRSSRRRRQPRARRAPRRRWRPDSCSGNLRIASSRESVSLDGHDLSLVQMRHRPSGCILALRQFL